MEKRQDKTDSSFHHLTVQNYGLFRARVQPLFLLSPEKMKKRYMAGEFHKGPVTRNRRRPGFRILWQQEVYVSRHKMA